MEKLNLPPLKLEKIYKAVCKRCQVRIAHTKNASRDNAVCFYCENQCARKIWRAYKNYKDNNNKIN